ncbi:hypothetical protein B0H10DRAFT_1963693 [Mycena sp. CBHHK59/15]|nr:hypothetical protein B0H10DRAFT_1963693 [Mycena sp. CBHHK59/15]
MPLSETALGAILIARSAYIETDNYNWQAIIETHTAEGTPERAAWLAHLTAVVDAIEDGKDIPEPPAGSTSAVSGGKHQKKKKSAAAVPGDPESERDRRHAQIRAQRILDLEGAPAEGEVGPARAKQVGRRHDKLVDNLIIEEDEINSQQKPVKVVYSHQSARSSMTPKHLIATAHLSQPYKFGLTEGNYTHSATANVKVFAVDRVDNAISSSLETVPRVIRSSTHWAVEDYIRLDSVPLARVISAGRKKDAGPAEGVVQSQAAEAMVELENQDWDVED